jgi:ribosomal protein S8
MISNENLEKAKRTSFLAHVTDEEITKLLIDCGYILDRNIEDETDGNRKPITRIYDSRNRKVIIEVCAINKFCQQVFNAMSIKMPYFMSNAMRQYNTSLIIIRDYSMFDLMHQDDSDMQNKFANFMYSKFGEKYRINYNKWITRQINKESNESNNERS